MRLTTSELIHAAYHAARYLPKASSQLMRDLAERLDITQAALCESLKIREALAAENAALKHAMSVTMEHVSVMDTGQAGVAAMIFNDAMHNSETPATDEFLREVRADAILFASYWLPDNGKYQDSIQVLAQEVRNGDTEVKFPVSMGKGAAHTIVQTLRGNSNGGAL